MVLSCHRCSQSNSTPRAFLLTCGSCKRAWHHRCHIPPIEDSELIQRIRSTNAGDHGNGLANWNCKRCKKKQVAGTSIHPTAELLTHDDNGQLPPADTHGIVPLNDQQKEISDANVATGSVQPSSSIDAAIQPSRDVELGEHGSHCGHQQRQSSHTDSFTGNLDTNQSAATMDKKLHGKRALQEQAHHLELFLDRPAAFIKYARAPDGRKLVPPEHSSWRAPSPEYINSRFANLASDDAIHSASTSRFDREETHVHQASVAKNPDSNESKMAALTNPPSGPPIEHNDTHMERLDDDNDDLYETSSQLRTLLSISSNSKPLNERRECSVMQDDQRMHQLQERGEEIDNSSGGVFLSNHEPTPENSFATQTSRTEAPLGPSWLKARYSVADDPCFCDKPQHTCSGRKRKKSKAIFLGDVVHSVATLDGGLLEFLFFPNWLHETQAKMTTW